MVALIETFSFIFCAKPLLTLHLPGRFLASFPLLFLPLPCRYDWMQLFHHASCLVGSWACWSSGRSGADVTFALFVAELANPFMYLRYLLREVGWKDTTLARTNQVGRGKERDNDAGAGRSRCVMEMLMAHSQGSLPPSAPPPSGHLRPCHDADHPHPSAYPRLRHPDGAQVPPPAPSRSRGSGRCEHDVVLQVHDQVLGGGADGAPQDGSKSLAEERKRCLGRRNRGLDHEPFRCGDFGAEGGLEAWNENRDWKRGGMGQEE